MKSTLAPFALVFAIGACSDMDKTDETPACARPSSTSASELAVSRAASSAPPVAAKKKMVLNLPEVIAPDPLTLEPLPRALPVEIACAEPRAPGRRLPTGASPRIRGLYETCKSALVAAKEGSARPPAQGKESATLSSGLGACTTLAAILKVGHGGPENALLATNLAARACSLGEMSACKSLADASLSGLGAPFDPECAEATLRWACDHKEADACAEIGTLEKSGHLLRLDPGEAAELSDRACKEGSFEGCLDLAGLFMKTDAPKAAALQERAIMLGDASCRRGDGNACREIGWLENPKMTMHRFSPEVKAAHVDAAKSLELAAIACRLDLGSGCSVGANNVSVLEETCKAGDFERCIDLAFEHLNGGGAGGDFPPADRKLLEDACVGGSSRGCWALGNKNSEGVLARACAEGELSACRVDPRLEPGVPPSPEQRKKACDQGSAIDCRELGDAAIKAGSVGDALHLYVRACPSIRSRGDYRDIDAIACAELGRRYRKGDGTTRDPDRAVEVLLTGCFADGRLNERGAGCVDLAEMFDTGDGVPRDRDRATDLYAGLCTAQRKGCDEVHARLGGAKQDE